MRVAILTEEYYDDRELWYPYYRFQEAGAEVVIVGPEAGKAYASKQGLPAVVDLASSEARAGDFAAVFVPGGYAPDRMRRDPGMLRFVQEMHQQGKPIGAICHAGWLLISADILRGRTVTSVGAIRDDMVNAGATWVDEPVVVDGNLVTSRGPHDMPAMLPAMIGLLE